MDNEFRELWKFLYYPKLKSPKNIRLYLTDGQDSFYLNNGEIKKEYHELDFRSMINERGNILEMFSKVEFLMAEIMRLKILGYEVEKSEMMADLISSVPVNRKISFLKKWNFIDS